ncbi:Protein NHR-76 [Aphelenchoides avenae]|nr:Protein NHR-76 [Aphelenchus avenae]
MKSYKTVQERRRLLHCPRTLRDLFSSMHPPYEPYEFFGKHKDRIKDFSADFGLMIEFLASFEPFRMLGVDDKVTNASVVLPQRIYPFQLVISKAFLRVFYYYQVFYLTYINGGHKINRIYRADYTYFEIAPPPNRPSTSTLEAETPPASVAESPASVHEAEEGCGTYAPKPASEPTSSSAKSEVSNATKSIFFDKSYGKTTYRVYSSSLRTVCGQMESIGMTETEFVATCLVLIFEPKRDGLSEIAKRVLSSARNKLFEDWLDFYRKCCVSNGEERMGNCLLLLTALLQEVHNHESHYHMFRLFSLVDYDKLLDEIFL